MKFRTISLCYNAQSFFFTVVFLSGFQYEQTVLGVDLNKECFFSLPDLPKASKRVSAVVFQNNLIYCGGSESNGANDVNTCYDYEPVNKKWEMQNVTMGQGR